MTSLQYEFEFRRTSAGEEAAKNKEDDPNDPPPPASPGSGNQPAVEPEEK